MLGRCLRAALVASCIRGALPPVDLRAVCFVLAILVVLCIMSDVMQGRLSGDEDT